MGTSSPPESSDRRSPNNLPILGNDKVSLVELKILANRMLPRNSILRALILSELDYLPKVEARVKAEVYARLLHEEIARDIR